MDKITIEQQIKELQDQLKQLEIEEQERKNQVNNPDDLISFLIECDNPDFISGASLVKYYFENVDLDKTGNFSLVFEDSNHDDGANAIETVYFFEKFNCYVKFEGYYSSYEDYVFETCYLVKPEEYTAIRYNKI